MICNDRLVLFINMNFIKFIKSTLNKLLLGSLLFNFSSIVKANYVRSNKDEFLFIIYTKILFLI